MKLLTSLVSVKRINSSVERSQFSENELERSAQAILEAEGIINPIILEKETLESYQVIYGDFEYYAAVRAREIDPRKGEMISAFIIEDEKENAIKMQIEIFRKSHQNLSVTPTITDNSDQILLNIQSRITNIETRLEKKINDLKKDYQIQINELQKKIAETKQQLPEKIEPLQALNTFDLQQLTSSLKKIKFANQSKIISNIIKARETQGKFQSFIDVIDKVDKLGDKTMIKIIDQFSN